MSSDQTQARAFGLNRPARFLTIFAVFSMAVAALFSGVGTAKADTPDGRIGHCWLTLTSDASVTSASQYLGFLQSIQNASGHYWRSGLMQTQSYSTQNSLIRADLNFQGEELQLWFSPNNLYLRGFTTHYGETWQFNDSDYSLESVMEGLGRTSPDWNLLPDLGRFRTLNFGSNYNSLTQAAGRGRDSMPISHNDLWNSAWQLQYATDGGPSTARSLMLMIQFTSEAARFWDVYGVMSDIMRNQGSWYPGLPAVQQELENSWDGLSRYAYALYSGQNPSPYNVGPHVGNVSGSTQVNSRLALLLGNPAQASSTGDWWHTEL